MRQAPFWRQLVLLTLLSATSLSSSAQFFFGYNISECNARDVNRVIHIYNAQHPWLDKEMGQIKTGGGVTAGFTFLLSDEMGMELSWMGWHSKVHSRGTQPGTNQEFRRDLKVRNNLLKYGLYGKLSDNFRIGATIDIGANKGWTRAYATDGEKPEYEKIWKVYFPVGFKTLAKTDFGSTLWVQGNIGPVGIRPYYYISWFDGVETDGLEPILIGGYVLGSDQFPDSIRSQYRRIGIALTVTLGDDENW